MATDPHQTTRMVLRDLTEIELQRQAIDKAASGSQAIDSRSALQVSQSDDVRVEVLVLGAKYEALPLVARALNVETDDLRPRTVFRALAELGYKLDGLPGREYKQRAQGSDDPGGDADQSASSQEGDPPGVPEVGSKRPDLTPELAVALQRDRGRWVAVSDGRIVASAETLRDLRAKLDMRREVTVFQVPDSDRAAGGA